VPGSERRREGSRRAREHDAGTTVPAGARTPDFPRATDLRLPGRLTVGASAGLDVLLRTAGASLVAASMLPHALRSAELRHDAAALEHYAELADRADRDEIFTPPGELPVVDVVRRGSTLTPWLPGAVELIRFPSGYVAADLGARVAYTRPRNSVAWAQHWRHEDGPRPTVIVAHGFMASPYWVNRVFFSLPWWYANGYDLLLVTLPFHGRRAKLWQYSGAEFFAGGAARLVEGVLHAVHDVRTWIDHLESLGVEQVGMTGISLGGYVTALMAAVEPRLWFAIPNAPVTDFLDVLDHWTPAGRVAEHVLDRNDVDRGLFADALRAISPLHHAPLLPRDRLFVIAGLGDRLAPPEQARRLWEHWGHPTMHAFPGNHVLHVDRGAYLRRIGQFIRGTGFGVPDLTAPSRD
jgi:hypothetical protein